jgi:hypothetical protein
MRHLIKNTKINNNKDNHNIHLNLLKDINFDIEFECKEKEIKNFCRISTAYVENKIIVAKK